MKDERINLCFPGEQKILLADGNKIDVDSLFIELQKDIPDEYYTWSMNNKGKFIKNKINPIFIAKYINFMFGARY